MPLLPNPFKDSEDENSFEPLDYPIDLLVKQREKVARRRIDAVNQGLRLISLNPMVD